ncbi:MAG: hypothetical protein ACR2NU_04675, partial [Aeoliella sp.]
MTMPQLWQLAGWTMIHFLWIGAALAAMTALFRLPLGRVAPAIRYAVTLVCFFAISTAPLVVAAWLWTHEDLLPRSSLDVAPPITKVNEGMLAEPQAAMVDLAETPIVIDTVVELPPQPTPTLRTTPTHT